MWRNFRPVVHRALRRSVARRGVATSTCTNLMERLSNADRTMCLEASFYIDPDIYQADLECIFHQEWLWAGVDAQLESSGSWITMQVGNYPIFLIRGKDGEIRGFHNICRHRGHPLCEGSSGKIRGRSLVCPYHQWTYSIDCGSLKFARDMGSFDASLFGLRPVHVENIGGFLYVCVAEDPPAFPQALREKVIQYMEPYGLQSAKVAHQSRIVEEANWKLAWENNRECYHCHTRHPDLWQFQSAPSPSTGAPLEPEGAEWMSMCEERHDLPSAFWGADDLQYRFVRQDLVKGAQSFTNSGKPAVAEGRKRMGRMPPHEDLNAGSLMFYHNPSTFQHHLADFSIVFRILPLGPSTTEVLSTWLVPGDAEEGEDYCLEDLTVVWNETNDQDKTLVETTQKSMQSPAFLPGPYNPQHEIGVMQFMDWYRGTMQTRLPTLSPASS